MGIVPAPRLSEAADDGPEASFIQWVLHLTMGWRRGALFVLAALVLAALVPPLPAVGDGFPPTITEVTWTPRYPIHPSNVTVSARVTDPDGVAFVEAIFCYQPAWLCLYKNMTDPDADGVYTGVPIGPGQQTTQASPGTFGAKLNVTARDAVGNSIVTQNFGVLFVDALNLSFAAPVFASASGQPFTVWGSAFYEDNTTAPAEGVAVIVSVPGDQQTATVLANGTFEATLTAPSADGTYAVTAEAQDRTLADSEQATLAVSSNPTPDLAIGSLRPSTPDPLAGPLAIRFVARNVGTDAATNVRVLVELVSATVPIRTLLDVRVTIPGLGGAVPLVAQTTLAAGTHTVRVSLDAADEVTELNEGNNVEELTFTVRAPPEPGPPLVWMGVGGVASAAAVGGIALAVRRKGRRDAA